MCLLVSFNSFPFYSILSFIIIQPLFFGISLNIAMDSAVFLFVYYCVSVCEVSLGFECEIKQSSERELAKERVREEMICS
jgi:hypothetical protein